MSAHRFMLVQLSLLLSLLLAAPAAAKRIAQGRDAQRFFSRAGATTRTVARIERSLRHLTEVVQFDRQLKPAPDARSRSDAESL